MSHMWSILNMLENVKSHTWKQQELNHFNILKDTNVDGCSYKAPLCHAICISWRLKMPFSQVKIYFRGHLLLPRNKCIFIVLFFWSWWRIIKCLLKCHSVPQIHLTKGLAVQRVSQVGKCLLGLNQHRNLIKHLKFTPIAFINLLHL